MRRLIGFDCAGETLAATLDEAPGTTGLLIVSGGNEIRIGAHRGMADLAGRVAAQGYPVFRYDRRGIGDSSGENNGFESTAEDISEAVAAFRQAAPQVDRVVAFGNCDAATALILFGEAAGIDRIIASNPWTIERQDDLPPAAAIRARYLQKLKDPRELIRLATGGVSLSMLWSGLRKVSSKKSEIPALLPTRLAAALRTTNASVMILLASRDNTAIAFTEHWNGNGFSELRDMIPCEQCETDSHSFARAEDKAWLEARILTWLAM